MIDLNSYDPKQGAREAFFRFLDTIFDKDVPPIKYGNITADHWIIDRFAQINIDYGINISQTNIAEMLGLKPVLGVVHIVGQPDDKCYFKPFDLISGMEYTGPTGHQKPETWEQQQTAFSQFQQVEIYDGMSRVRDGIRRNDIEFIRFAYEEDFAKIAQGSRKPVFPHPGFYF